MQVKSVFFLLALAAPGGRLPEATAAPRPPREVCAVAVSAPPLDPARQAKVPSFSATIIRDLEFRTEVRRPDASTLYLRVYTPRGHLYQTLTVATTGAAPGQASPPVLARLPVAGTAITTNGLYGRWKVEPWLGGDAAACGAGREFVIAE